MLTPILRYVNTIRYLKWKQISYRIYYWLKDRFEAGPPYFHADIKRASPPAVPLKLIDSLPAFHSYLGDHHFRFLNTEHRFGREIDWNLKSYGKLWTYNLNYFEFLAQPELSVSEGMGLIQAFIREEENITDGMEPFPISLRTIFWIKFLTAHRVHNPHIDQSIFRQLQMLYGRLEYHLMGNHLLENGFALLFGAYYFADHRLFLKAEYLLQEQLGEQILFDGAHFELSPMYHQLMLYRVLDGINLLQQNPSTWDTDLLELLHTKARSMLSWLREMTFSNGNIPMVNDSADGIAPTTGSLVAYAQSLGVMPQKVSLKESGYRMFRTGAYELLIDIGQIGPDYIPGHAHSDTFNFIIHYRQTPLLVDTGISTYEKNERRQQERSTTAHNTVMVDGREQSGIWGGFRVAERARVKIIRETKHSVEAIHDGYRKIGVTHHRSFTVGPADLQITDRIEGGKSAEAFFHFHPQVRPILNNDEVTFGFGQIRFRQFERIYFTSYDYCSGFNNRQQAIKAVVEFKNTLITKILLH